MKLPENAWAYELFAFYFDVKDFGAVMGHLKPTAYVLKAMRAIREGSGGSLGNPPLL